MWEYLHISFKSYPMSYELDEFGLKGWELVSAIKDGYKYEMFFKRKK